MHEFTGSVEEIGRKSAWFKTKPCRKCWFEQKEKEQEEETKRVAKLADAQKLPTLKGSQKQIDWALRIRQHMITAFEEYIKNCTPEEAEQLPAMRESFELNVMATTESNWFIDQRAMEKGETLIAQLKAWVSEDQEVQDE